MSVSLRYRANGSRARARRPGGPGVAADRRVPALIVKIGQYPLHHGGVGAIRTLGRLGVPVYAITEDSYTPAAVSRYCGGSFAWPTTGREEPGQLVEGLKAIGRRLDRQTVAVPTDEEAAVLLAEHAGELAEHFLLPAVPPELPRRLASKQGLYQLCREQGVPAPYSAFPTTASELAEVASRASYPLVAKNLEAWVRKSAPVVGGTTLVRSEPELLAQAREWGASPSVILQDYIPRQDAEDWIVHLYCDWNSDCMVVFTGIKIRSWPPHAGMTACAHTMPNPELADAAVRFCKAVGFSGVADLDWRLDRRDGQYKLLDFNPRVGAQFRLFETSTGVDVVRALHLDLTGREVEVGDQPVRRRLIVENVDIPARLAYLGRATTPKPVRATRSELAWLAADDPLPAVAMSARVAGPVISYLTRAWRSRRLARTASKRRPGRPQEGMI